MTRKVIIKDEQDLLQFCNLMNTFKSNIDIGNGNHIVDAKSVLGIHALGLYNHLDVTIMTTDENEQVKFANEIRRFEV